MTHSGIAENSAVLIAVGPILLGLFAFAWTAVRQSWRLFGFGLSMFSIPFVLFICAEILANLEVGADLAVFVLACGSLAVSTVSFGLTVLLIWRNKETATNGKDFKPPNAQ